MPNILSMQKRCESLIRRWGASKRGQIVRSASVRATAYMAFKEFTPSERGLFADDARNIAVSAVGLSDIDFEQDTIIFSGNTYKILSPPRGARPDGNVVYYQVPVVQIKGA